VDGGTSAMYVESVTGAIYVDSGTGTIRRRIRAAQAR
jgi:dsRNA-specific ribonuclease